MLRVDLLEHCRTIVQEQMDEGIEPSARGVYYRLVGLGLLTQDAEGERKNYRKVVDTISKAKLAGDFPLEWLRDNLRVPGSGQLSSGFPSVRHASERIVDYLSWLPGSLINPARWYNHPVIPCVMVEKDTLEGTIRGPCREYSVPWYVCRGYSSVTGLYAWTEQLVKEVQAADWTFEVVVLYLGDHDPEGLNIPEAAEKVIRKIAELKGWDLPAFHFRRIALTRKQAIDTGAPPMKVKTSSSRAAGYSAEHGTKSWEIEALDPVVLRDLLKAELAGYFDPTIPERFADEVKRRRGQLIHTMRRDAVEIMDRALNRIDDDLYVLPDDDDSDDDADGEEE